MWKAKWQAISARILSLIPAAEFMFESRESDNCGITPMLLRNAGEIASSLQRFLAAYQTQLPGAATESLKRFLVEYDGTFGPNSSNKLSGLSAVAGVLPMLTSFRSEFEFLLVDTEACARDIVVRALTHLQRSIVADEAIQARWNAAFERGELSCEALGACHLLLHGIWAFKTSATGSVPT